MSLFSKLNASLGRRDQASQDVFLLEGCTNKKNRRREAATIGRREEEQVARANNAWTSVCTLALPQHQIELAAQAKAYVPKVLV